MPNKDGQLYPKTIQSILSSKQLLPIHLGNNSAGFTQNETDYFIEVMNRRTPDFGEKEVKWNAHEGWHWALVDETTELYDGFGVLEIIDKKFTPKRYSVNFNDFTPLDRKFDEQRFEQSNIKLDNLDALYEFYRRKNCHYIQIEDKGFYILGEDKAQLLLKFPVKPLVNLEARPTLRLMIKSQNRIPYYDYSFTAVIQIKRSDIVPSNFDLEEKNGRLFPPLGNDEG